MISELAIVVQKWYKIGLRKKLIFVSLQTIVLWIVVVLAGGQSLAVAVGFSGMWQVTPGFRKVNSADSGAIGQSALCQTIKVLKILQYPSKYLQLW